MGGSVLHHRWLCSTVVTSRILPTYLLIGRGIDAGALAGEGQADMVAFGAEGAKRDLSNIRMIALNTRAQTHLKNQHPQLHLSHIITTLTSSQQTTKKLIQTPSLNLTSGRSGDRHEPSGLHGQSDRLRRRDATRAAKNHGGCCLFF